jgi:hypothetical protein
MTRSADLRVGLAQAGIGYLLGSLGACLILLARDLHVARGELAWLSAGFGAALIIVGVAGAWILRAGATAVLRVGAGALAAGTALLAVAPSVLLAQTGALVLGVGSAGIVLASPALLGDRQAAVRLATVTAVGMLAGVLGPVLISLVDATTGNGRLALLVPMPALLWLAVTTASLPAKSEPVAGAKAPAAAPLQGSRVRIAIRWLCLVLAVAAEFAFHLWGAARLQDSGLGPSAAAAAAAAFPLGMAAGRLGGQRFIGKRSVISLGAALGMVGALGLAAPTGPVLATTALGLAGLGIAVLYPVTLSRLMALPALGLGGGAAIGAVGSGVAALISPAAVHALAAATSLGASFIAVAAVLAVLLVLDRRMA